MRIGHVGRIPYLFTAGFDGPILCNETSAKLLPIVLEGGFKLGVSRDQKQVEWYLALFEQRIIALPYNTWFSLRDLDDLVCRIRLQRAGHILGSAYVEFDLAYLKTGEKKRVVFSCDLGAPHAPLLPVTKPPYDADILVIESTYGDRQHEDRRTRRQCLERVVEQAFTDNGTVLIPALSIGRTQELLYELEEVIHSAQSKPSRPFSTRGGEGDFQQSSLGTNWPELPVILDSPLAGRFTAAYRELQPFWNQQALKRVKSGRRPQGFEQLITVDSHGDHMRMVQHLARTARPAIVIVGNGMCSSGGIFSYLNAMLGDQRGTPGQAIQTFGPVGGYVDIDGERFDIRAGIATIGGYSAHADQDGLVRFVTGMRKPPLHVRIVHGEPKAKQALAARLTALYESKQLAFHLTIPQKGISADATTMETV